MNIVEYLAELENVSIENNEYGDVIMKDDEKIHPSYELQKYFSDYEIENEEGETEYVITKQSYEDYKSIEIIPHISREEFFDFEDTREPLYRMRGKTITKEQAAEFINQTDFFFSTLEKKSKKQEKIKDGKRADTGMWFLENIVQNDIGWVYPDGCVGCDYFCHKYPEVTEWLTTLFFFYRAYPDFDMIFAMTTEEEAGLTMLINWINGYRKRKNQLLSAKDFCKKIAFGFWLHDRKIEIVDKQKATRLYLKYEAESGYPVERYYEDYYELQGTHVFPLDTLLRMIEERGLNAQKVMDNAIEKMQLDRYREEWEAYKKKQGEQS